MSKGPEVGKTWKQENSQCGRSRGNGGRLGRRYRRGEWVSEVTSCKIFRPVKDFVSYIECHRKPLRILIRSTR